MPASPAILDKVKKLLALSNSSNHNEAATAKVLADKLISKYNITEEDLSSLDPKVFYGEDEKLFSTIGLYPWRQQLALAVATYFDCQIVQEETVPAEGEHEFSYYVYGEDDQVRDTQFVYHAFNKKVEALIDTRCFGKEPDYTDSYCEGVVESIKTNIQMYGIDIPEIKRPLKKEEAAPVSNGIVKSGENREQPTEKRADVKAGSLIKDIGAYFTGIADGQQLSLQDIIEIESRNKQSAQIEQ